ncbi:MAG: glycosyltransferase family 2 protein [Clostridia bacterium]|nr:glycosyltransferase family 2 protein [Clostridia bacterium]
MISVIVPVYNGEKTIKRTLDSILNQTYRDIEVIVVNDGSKDGTKDVLESMAKKDGRLKIITKENGGVSSARNAGLEKATGEFITFLDADDEVESDMYEFLINAAKEYGADIAHCGYRRVENGTDVFVSNSGKVYVQSHDEALSCEIEGRIFTGSLCNKLYKSFLLKEVRFDESIKINEDVLVNYYAFKNADKSVYIDVPKYVYNMNTQSATHTVDRVRFVNDCERVARIMAETEEYTRVSDSAKRHLFDILKAKFVAYYRCDKENGKNVCKQTAREMYDIMKSGVVTSTKDKIICIIERFFPFVFGFVYFVYDKIRKPNEDVKQ